MSIERMWYSGDIDSNRIYRPRMIEKNVDELKRQTGGISTFQTCNAMGKE